MGRLHRRPCPVMVWLPVHCGKFLDSIAGERLFAAFSFTMFSGLRQDEIVGLNWAEVFMDEGVAYVLETGSGNDPKSDAGTRAVPLSAVVAKDLKAWRKAQAAERLAWGSDWTDTGRVFTHEDGEPITGQWLSRRFATLAWRADLPYVRFHPLPARRRVAGQGCGRFLEGDLSRSSATHGRASPTPRT